MKKLLISLSLSTLFIFAHIDLSSAQFVTGNTLHKWCNSERDKNLCQAYILGILDSNDILNLWEGKCVFFEKMPNVIGQQFLDVIIKGIKDNPKDRDLSAAGLAFAYIKDEFPCPQ